MTREPILAEREKTHGDYVETASCAQALKAVVKTWVDERGRLEPLTMTTAMSESLDMICTKISRILVGDPACKDHWDDIAGYAKLISERL